MSNVSNLDRIYVRDLDCYVSIFADRDDPPGEDAHDRYIFEQQLLKHERLHGDDAIDDVALLANRAVDLAQLTTQFGLASGDWLWASYQANRQLMGLNTARTLEPKVVKEILSLGRTYAIRRYARKENVATAAAMAASLSYGMTAMMYRYFIEEGLSISKAHRHQISRAFDIAHQMPSLTAYEKTTAIRNEIHAVAQDIGGPNGHYQLNSSRIRKILSLVRLHFSVAETKLGKFDQILELERTYEAKRASINKRDPAFFRRGARYIRDWQLQHLWPLTWYFPIPIRQALARGMQHVDTKPSEAPRSAWVNELAVMYCVMQAADRHRHARCIGTETKHGHD